MKPVVLCITNKRVSIPSLTKGSLTIIKNSSKEDVNKNIKELMSLTKVGTYRIKDNSISEITNKFLDEVNNYPVTIINLVDDSKEDISEYIEKIYKKTVLLKGKFILITGNSETKDSTLIMNDTTKLNSGSMIDVVPTILDIMHLKSNKVVGKSLIQGKKSPMIFIILSGIIMFSLLLTYTIRFIHFYKLEHSGQVIENTLVNKILNNNKIVSNNGLVMNGSSYIFKGNVENNYVLYSGYLFRIVGINKDNTIKLVTDDITASLVWSYDTDYNNSYVKTYLEKVFYKSLTDPTRYLAKEDWCIDEIDKKYNICKNKIKAEVGLLTYNDYVLANSNNGYLNINKYWWTMNKAKDNKVWYVFNEGGINNDSKDNTTYYSFGIRPSINLKADVGYINGDGTKEKPYIIENNNEINVGSYINYSGYTWKVISKDDKLKLVMEDCLKADDECMTYNFSRSNNEYDETKRNSLAFYLNNNFYYQLDKTHLVKGIWYIGTYNDNTSYDYNNIFTESVEADVGILNISENNKTNSYTLTRVDDGLLYSLKDDGSLYAVDVTEELYIYPSIYLDLDCKVVTGTGTIDNPFEIE